MLGAETRGSEVRDSGTTQKEQVSEQAELHLAKSLSESLLFHLHFIFQF